VNALNASHSLVSEPALQVDGLSKKFGGINALNDVTFSMSKGELLGIVGPNGSGKTTLLSIIQGLVLPHSGSVRFAKHDITALPSHHVLRRAMAATFQNPRLFGSLTVSENLELGARSKGVPGDIVADRLRSILERFGLQTVSATAADALSGGQRKIVELARAMLTHPSLLILDEPTGGVDLASRETISLEISRASQRNVSVLVVSHDLPWTFSLCNRILVLDHGVVLVSGTPREIESDPRVVQVYL